MKMSVVLAVTLLSASAFAANDSIKLCNPENKAQYLEITVQGNTLKQVSGDGKNVSQETSKIEKTLALTAQDLNKIASSNNMNVTLVSGTAYGTGDGAWAIVSDSTGVKYLVVMMGPMLQLAGDSASCK